MNTRFAPSPTGHLHIGGARTALFSYLSAKVNNGQFAVRFEDTDNIRSQVGFEKSISESLQWLGIIPDSVVKQSERSAHYHRIVEELLAFGYAYHCDCTTERLDALRAKQREDKEIPRYDNLCRDKGLVASDNCVLRFNLSALPQSTLSFADVIHGEMNLNIDQLDDFVLRRSIENYGSEDGFTYNFCACVDDREMQIECVVRGDDHMRNTFRQVAINRVLHWPLPKYCHLPMVLNDQGQRLSKRDGAANVLDFARMGIPAEPLIDYLARLGWSHGDEEVFGLRKLAELFKLEDVATSPAKFDLNKLRSLSSHYIKNIDNNAIFSEFEKYLVTINDAVENQSVKQCNHRELLNIINEYGKQSVERAIILFVERSSTYQDVAVQITQLYLESAQPQDIRSTIDDPTIKIAIQDLIQKWQQISVEQWQNEALTADFKATLAAHSLKFPQLAMPLRFLLFNQTKGPSIVTLAECLGKTKTLEKLSAGLSD